MRKVLTLPIKTGLRFNAAQYAKTLPAPHPCIIQEPVIEQRSRLFDPEIVAIPKRQKPGRVRRVEREEFTAPAPLRRANGSMNRPDKSEMKNNLTFNWDR